ncbi:MAG: hypothetical protein WBG54_21500 [Acidobacteriaceae bacterium]
MPLESGQPLDLTAGGAYTEAKSRLEAISLLTVMTDGVVEAAMRMANPSASTAPAQSPAEHLSPSTSLVQ